MGNFGRVVAVGIVCAALFAGRASNAASDPAHRIDINTATAAELAKLPGVGPAKAQAIVQHRTQAPFAKADELRNVKGIGDKLYDRLKDQITVEAPHGATKDRGG